MLQTQNRRKPSIHAPLFQMFQMFQVFFRACVRAFFLPFSFLLNFLFIFFAYMRVNINGTLVTFGTRTHK